MSGQPYTCALCGREYEKTRDDDEAMGEAVERFGAAAMIADPAIVCDDCYRATKALSDAGVWSKAAALNASEQIRLAVDEATKAERCECAAVVRGYSEVDQPGVFGCATAYGEGQECCTEGIARAIEGRGA